MIDKTELKINNLLKLNISFFLSTTEWGVSKEMYYQFHEYYDSSEQSQFKLQPNYIPWKGI